MVQSSRDHLELVTVYELCRTLGGTLDVDRSCRVALNILSVHLGLTRVIVVRPDEDGVLRACNAIGLTSDNLQRACWRPGEGVIGCAFQEGMPVVVPDVRNASEFIDRTGAFGPRDALHLAMVAVPIKTEQEVLGVLAAQRPVEDQIRLSADVRMLTMTATLMAQAFAIHQTVALERERLAQQNARLQKALSDETPAQPYQLKEVIGHSEVMQRVFSEVHQAAPSRSTVLLRGESGTGKEAIARSIHALSPRKDKPFIKVNCAALTETLLESELFGHEKGAFTGASGERKGRFELAHGGTLFLDEVGDISAAFQAKLLRVLQEREFERVGGNKTIQVDVRLICATNRNLEKMVQRGEYRADLYYRINVVSISLPPLRDRREDIPPLVHHFLRRFNEDNHRHLEITRQAMQVLQSCYWPGNVRELENCIERAATMAHRDLIEDAAFPCRQNQCLTQALHGMDKDDAVYPVNQIRVLSRGTDAAAHAAAPGHPDPPDSPGLAPAAAPDLLQDRDPPADERARLIWAMEQSGWVQAKAARLLRITPRQMGYALRRHHIEIRKF